MPIVTIVSYLRAVGMSCIIRTSSCAFVDTTTIYNTNYSRARVMSDADVVVLSIGFGFQSLS